MPLPFSERRRPQASRAARGRLPFTCGSSSGTHWAFSTAPRKHSFLVEKVLTIVHCERGARGPPTAGRAQPKGVEAMRSGGGTIRYHRRVESPCSTFTPAWLRCDEIPHPRMIRGTTRASAAVRTFMGGIMNVELVGRQGGAGPGQGGNGAARTCGASLMTLHLPPAGSDSPWPWWSPPWPAAGRDRLQGSAGQFVAEKFRGSPLEIF